MLLVLPCLSLPSLPCATKAFLSSAWLPMRSYLKLLKHCNIRYKKCRIVKKVSFQKNGHSIKNLTLTRIIVRSFRFERVGLTNWVKTQIFEGRSFLRKQKETRNMSQILYTVVLSVKKLPCPSSICPMPILPCLSLPSLPCATKPFLSSPWLPMKSFLSTAIYDTNSGRKVIDKKSVFRKKTVMQSKTSHFQNFHISENHSFFNGRSRSCTKKNHASCNFDSA